VVDVFDLVVLGGGTGGYSAAIRAAQLGLVAAIVEEDKVGGVCLHRGCIPTKVMLESAEALSLVQRSKKLGIEADNIRLDFSSVARRQREVVEGLHKNLQNLIRKHRIEVIAGRGRFLSPTEIAVGGERKLTARHVIIATGSRSKDLPGLSCDGQHILNSDHALTLETLPESLVVIGAGSVGMEFASAYLDFGCQVSVVEMMPNLLPLEDADLGAGIGRLLAQRGANILTGTRVLADGVRAYDDVVEVPTEREGEKSVLRAQKVLVAVGRQGNVEDLGLEKTGVQTEGGCVRVDEHMRTAEPNIYAVGDVAGGLLLAHVAAAEGVLAAEAIAGQKPEPIDYSRMPRVVYTRPRVAAVGLTEAEAKAQGRQVKLGRYPFRYNAMALIRDEPDGFVKVVTDTESGDLLGVHILGAGADEVIGQGGLARWLDASAWEVAASVRPHPSLSEALGDALEMATGGTKVE
jgi:dihydrolipoamide dehydrogenase